jgi:alpha-beta hydrolase superfamily lysophospholipase
LFYRAWLPEQNTDRAVILFHRGHEHSGRWQDVVDKLDLADFALFAWDARGHGRSPGERGDAENLGVLVRDVDAFVGHVSRHYGIPIENIVVFAHSVGSVLAATWVHDYAPKIRALVLGSPALRVQLYVPFAIPALRLAAEVQAESLRQQLRERRSLLTHDPAKIASYDADPLITRRIAVNLLVDLHDAGRKTGGRCGGDHRADPGAHVGRGLGGRSGDPASVFRAAGFGGQGDARLSGLLPRHVQRAGQPSAVEATPAASFWKRFAQAAL